jgi:hypothetical protein
LFLNPVYSLTYREVLQFGTPPSVTSNVPSYNYTIGGLSSAGVVVVSATAKVLMSLSSALKRWS